MSAQLRIRTLITHMGRVYSAPAADRTQIVTTAIDDIVVKLNPLTPEQWVHAEHDVRRILNVWRESEGRTPAAMEFASNILSAFTEAAAIGAVAAALQHDVVTLPELEITEKPAPAPEVRLLTLSLPQPVFDEDEDEEEEEEEVEVEEDEDEEEAEPEPAPVKKLPAPAPAPVAEVDSLADGDEEVDADVESEHNSDDEEAIVEPEAEADADAEEELEEEGMEVEKRTIRGRDYWIDINTNKLYAVADDDEVGDEVGAVINGRPVFVTA